MAEQSKLKRALVNWNLDVRQLSRLQSEEKEEKYERGVKTHLEYGVRKMNIYLIRGQDNRVEQKQDLKR